MRHRHESRACRNNTQADQHRLRFRLSCRPRTRLCQRQSGGGNRRRGEARRIGLFNRLGAASSHPQGVAETILRDDFDRRSTDCAANFADRFGQAIFLNKLARPSGAEQLFLGQTFPEACSQCLEDPKGSVVENSFPSGNFECAHTRVDLQTPLVKPFDLIALSYPSHPTSPAHWKRSFALLQTHHDSLRRARRQVG